jgi:hypothetical protein
MFASWSRCSPFVFADSDALCKTPVANFGSVWEARDAFQSDTGAEKGPMVGYFTGDEAAYAPLPVTLQPHRSQCWVFRRTCATAQLVDGSDIEDSEGVGTGRRATVPLPSEVDLHLLMTSSMSRLAAGLQLKCEQSGGGVLGLFGGLGVPSVLRSDVTPVPPSTRGWIPPSDRVRDGDTRRTILHNMVYSLVYRAVQVASRFNSKSTVKSASSTASTVSVSSTSSQSSSASGEATFMARQLTGALSVFAKHLHMFVKEDGGIAASTVDDSGSATGVPVSNDVIVDMISNIRAALFFAVQELKVGCVSRARQTWSLRQLCPLLTLSNAD